MEEKIRNLIEGEVLKLGVSIDTIEYVKENQNYFLRIVVDRDEPLDIDKVVDVTNVISPLLDEANVINEPYTLEVWSKEKGVGNE
jgi:ribosome maturation factor RimP